MGTLFDAVSLNGLLNIITILWQLSRSDTVCVSSHWERVKWSNVKEWDCSILEQQESVCKTTQKHLKTSLPHDLFYGPENNEIGYRVVDAFKGQVLSVTFHYLIWLMYWRLRTADHIYIHPELWTTDRN